VQVYSRKAMLFFISDGAWADKTGYKSSRWNELDGTAIAWDFGDIEGYYNTATVYFAVER